MAPEIVTREGHSYAVDYYTLGALLHELVVGLPPFYSRDPDEMMENILNQRLVIPPEVTPKLADLLYKLLDKNKNK
jgi:serum/glucocorticoid-regulated kinase 2